jgi:parallel beta-helix repeat protein
MNLAPTVQSAAVHSPPLVIRADTRLEPGVFVLPEGLIIDADHVTLDGNGATLVGENRQGTGVSVNGRSNVTIRNLRIRDFYHGIVARQTRNLIIEHAQITSTAEVEANTVFLDVWRPATDPYGGGILLDQVEDAEIRDNDLQHQMNGLLSYRCRRLRVRRNNASCNSGFGIHLYETCDSSFEENWVDYCNRYQPRDRGKPMVGVGATGHMGADATGFLIVYRSCRNVFRRNSARCGGDGVFLAGRNHQAEGVACNDNLFEENDCSLSPNIGFEATFSSGNIFRNNWADRCNFGFWLGYSSRNVLEGNRMLHNRQAGIAAEHAVGFEVRRNDFQNNGTGILLWTRYVKAYYESAGNNLTVRDWLIEHNKFYRNGTGIAILADKDHGIRPVAESEAGRPELRPRDNVIRHNDIQDNRVGIHLSRADHTVIEQNKISKNVEADLRREDDHETVLGPNLGPAGAYL